MITCSKILKDRIEEVFVITEKLIKQQNINSVILADLSGGAVFAPVISNTLI